MTDWTPLVDISYAQGVADLAVIRDAGIPGVIIRACNALKRDVRFDRNWRSARDKGLDVAVYGFSNPKAVAGPQEQGAFLAELAHEASAAWVMHDEESYNLEGGPNPVLKGAPAAAWTRAKIERCLVDSQLRQVIYTNDAYWNPTMTPGIFDLSWPGRFTDQWRADLEYLQQFPLILARFIAQRKGPPPFDPLPRGVAPADWAAAVAANGKTPGIPRGYHDYIAHQFSAGGNGQGPVYGCASTDLDLNIFRTAAYQQLFHSAPTPPPGDDDMALNYYVVTGSNAKFIGTPARVSWTGPGDAKVEAAIATQIAAGNLIEVDLTGGPGAFAATFLDGDLPVGDSLHTWTGDEFANTAEIKARPPHGGTVDQVARDGVTSLQGTVASLDIEVGRIKTGLIDAGS